MNISRDSVISILREAKPWGSMTDEVVAATLDRLIAKVEALPDVDALPFCQQDRTRCLVVGANNHVMARFSELHNAHEFATSRPAHEHAKAYAAFTLCAPANLRRCTICGFAVDLSQGHVAPDPESADRRGGKRS